MQRTRNNSGFVLPAALLLVVVLVILGYSVLYLGQTQGIESVRELQDSQAFSLAEAGLHRALWKMRVDTLWTAGWSNVALGNGVYTVVIENAPDLGSSWLRIRSTGTVGNISRVVTQGVQSGAGWPAAFHYSIFWANPEGEYAPQLTFANSVDVLGDVFAYGNVHFTPGAKMGAGGLMYATGSVTGSGFTLGELPEPLPERVVVDTTNYGNLIDQASRASGGNWVVEKKKTYQLNGATLFVNGKADIMQQAVIQGPGTIVAAKEIIIGTGSKIIGGVNLISGTETIVENNSEYSGAGEGNVIYSEGKIEIKNNSSVQQAIIITEDMAIFSNNTDIRAIVYAGTVKLENSTHVIGALYANAFDGESMTNSATVEHDESVLEYAIPDGFPEGGEITLGRWDEE